MTMANRAGLDLDDLDVEGFEPTSSAPPVDSQSLKSIGDIANNAGFPSRQTPRQKRRVYRTGRTEQLNTKVTPDVRARFEAIADRQSWVMGETLENALIALEEKLLRK